MVKQIKEGIYRIYHLLVDRHSINFSYSQEGEDLILRRYFQNQPSGFFIDIGAHHPKRFSNTYYLYKMGWRGINIDAMPGSMKAFNRVRKDDINLECAISKIDHELTYYIFNEPALNGFSRDISKQRENNTYKILKEVKIKTKRLTSVLDNHIPHNVDEIDFMSIDVEGLDLEVLQSNDWDKYRPKLLLVELLNLEKFDKDPIYIFLIEKGYKFYAKTYYTYFFEDSLK